MKLSSILIANKKMMINVGKMKILKNNIINEFEIKYGK